MTEKIKALHDDMEKSLQSVDGYLSARPKNYPMNKKLCMECERTHPNAATKCRPCSSSSLCPKYCTSGVRLAKLLRMFRRAGLWPSLSPFQDLSASVIQQRISGLGNDLKHDCDAGKACPLIETVQDFIKKVDKITKNVAGLPLYPLYGLKRGSDSME